MLLGTGCVPATGNPFTLRQPRRIEWAFLVGFSCGSLEPKKSQKSNPIYVYNMAEFLAQTSRIHERASSCYGPPILVTLHDQTVVYHCKSFALTAQVLRNVT